MRYKKFILLVLFLGLAPFYSECKLAENKMDIKPLNTNISKKSAVKESKSVDQVYQSYLDYFEQVYKYMDENYYHAVSREAYNDFVQKFNTKIYAQFKDTGKSVDFIKWRSAALLVDHLKTQEDVFSALYPPKPAEEFVKSATGKRNDLGIEGHKIAEGYSVDKVEPRSDSYVKGLRPQDLILAFNSQNVGDLDDVKIKDFLNPLENAEVAIDYLAAVDKHKKQIKVKSQEYIKQTVFAFDTGVPNVYGIKLETFNRMTSEDMLRYMEFFRQQGSIEGLILDLRNNPGGPPLAAREISAFFLPGGDQFAYFHKKGLEEAKLDVPVIPEQFKYHGPMVIWVNKDSGSASELFSGILQRKGRAILMGSNSAGQVMLKSMFDMDDKAMLLLITSRGYHSDGTPFSFGGLIPDQRTATESEILQASLNYIRYMDMKNSGKIK
ncbi:MAG: hypothetical protein HQL25_06305 [Candidatus Omnitrophica bacterium]|nr:hypothetical protein [Candidatus Omnitrophota bacterium]